MTALTIARTIADAVLRTSGRRTADSTQDAPTQAVLTVLEAQGLWFMRMDRADGVCKAETARRVT